jgi:hypothetical protein
MLSAEANRTALKACLSPSQLVAWATLFIIYDTMFHRPLIQQAKPAKNEPWTTDRTQDELAIWLHDTNNAPT